MVDQPLNSFKNTELAYLAQVLFALLFTCSDTHQFDDIKKKPNQTTYYKPTVCHQQISSCYTFSLLKTMS